VLSGAALTLGVTFTGRGIHLPNRKAVLQSCRSYCRPSLDSLAGLPSGKCDGLVDRSIIAMLAVVFDFSAQLLQHVPGRRWRYILGLNSVRQSGTGNIHFGSARPRPPVRPPIRASGLVLALFCWRNGAATY